MPTVNFDANSKGILVTAKEMIKGEPGKDGYTPIKGIDYFDGKDGEPGPAGKDGYTPVKGIDYFDGAPGPQGEPGYTPIKGVDYFDGEPGPKGADGTMKFEDLTDEQKESLRGDDYVLTEDDKVEIAQLALGLMAAAEEVEF